MSSPFRLFLLLAITLVTSEAFARTYAVEAIVFTNEGAAGQSDEIWDAQAARTKHIQSKINGQFARAKTIQRPRSLSHLAGIRQALSSSSEHRVLFSGAWTQAERSYASSPLVRVDAQFLRGAIRVYAPNLLFAEINLQLAPNDISGQLLASDPKFFLNEKRKLKLNEVHYFDHPKFGVILRVSPF